MKRARAIALLLIAFCQPGNATAQRMPAFQTVKVEQGAQDPAISPDGASVAVSILGKIWLVPMSGGGAQQLSFGEGWDTQPAWSPDGKWLAYGREAAATTEIRLIDLDTARTRTLYSTSVAEPSLRHYMPIANTQSNGQIAFHPTRPRIFFSLTRSGILSIPIASGLATEIVTTQRQEVDTPFALSHDGKRIAFASADSTGRREIFVRELESGALSKLATKSGELFDLAWSRDDASLTYLVREEGAESIETFDVVTGNSRRRFTSEYENKQLAVAADGNSAVICAARRLYRVDLASAAIKPIAFEARFTVPRTAAADLVIINARIWNGKDAVPLDRATLEVKGGHIVSIGRDAPPRTRSSAHVIDARGQFLMPGLMDSHSHLASANRLQGFLENGVTSVREPGGTRPNYYKLNLRDAVNLGLMEGPTFFNFSELLNGLPLRDGQLTLTQSQAATALVKGFKRIGLDGVKVYMTLAPEVTKAVIEQAHAQGLVVLGDVARTPWSQAAEFRIDGLAHTYNYRWDYLPSQWQVFRDGEDPEIMRKRLDLANLSVPVQPDWERLDALFRRMARDGITLDPTVFPVWDVVDARSRAQVDGMPAGEALHNILEADMLAEILLRAYRAGVVLVAGTDGEMRVAEQVAKYTALGIPNHHALRTATANGAIAMKREHEFGTLAPGMRADMILIDGDPLLRSADLSNLTMVIKAGRVVVDNSSRAQAGGE